MFSSLWSSLFTGKTGCFSVSTISCCNFILLVLVSWLSAKPLTTRFTDSSLSSGSTGGDGSVMREGCGGVVCCVGSKRGRSGVLPALVGGGGSLKVGKRWKHVLCVSVWHTDVGFG